MKYLKLFETHSGYTEFIGGGGDSEFIKPNVSHCIEENDVHYNPRTWADEYLTFVALEDGTFTFNPLNGNVISYSTDNGSTWTDGNSVEVNNGDKVLWKCNFSSTDYKGNGYFKSTAQFDVKGNIMSLVYGDDFKGKIDLSGKNCVFKRLFYDDNDSTYFSPLVNAENLVLPATTLAEYCYSEMFRGCTSLKNTPKLPTITLADRCYSSMFYRCASLTTAPELPATTLTLSCYASMFRYCTSLTTAPELPATELANLCYSNMFYGCSNLTTAPELPATTLVNRCYDSMFHDCTSLNYIKCLATDISAYECTKFWVYGISNQSGTFIKNANMTSWTRGNDGIPNGWTVQDAS